MLMIVKNNLLNFKDAYIYQDTDYFKFSLDSLLLANFVTINLRDKNILDIATGNAPIPMLLSYRTKANIYGVEIQKSVFDLGVKSIIENKMDKQITIINLVMIILMLLLVILLILILIILYLKMLIR